MNRQQRRAAGKKLQHVPGGLDRAGQQVQAALDAIQKIHGLEGAVKTLEGLQGEIREANTLLKALVGDMETLNKELELQREVTLQLLRLYVGRDTRVSEEMLRTDEARIRAGFQITDESG